MARKTENVVNLEISTVGKKTENHGNEKHPLDDLKMTKSLKNLKNEKSLNNVKNEKCALKVLEYGKKTENHGK